MASSYVDRKVYVCYEDYTSKTCGMCGELNDKLGGKEVFQCVKCDFKEDRDVNGARNIMLKRLSELASG